MSGIARLQIHRRRLQLEYVKQKLDLDDYIRRNKDFQHRIHIRVVIVTLEQRLKAIDSDIEEIDGRIEYIRQQQSQG